MSSLKDAFDQLCCYTLSKGDSEFIHQHVIDSFAAQDATADDKPIRLTFALVGLYLHVEKGFTGREVQWAHMKIAKVKQVWPEFELPIDRGKIDASMVLEAPLDKRDEMIYRWCDSVWTAFSESRGAVESLLVKNKVSDVHSVLKRNR